MRIGLLVALAALATPALMAPVEAHSAPRPPDKDTRLLQDWVDDCGGDGGAERGSCRGSNDLLALDVQEVHDASLGDLVVFRFYLDRGSGGSRSVALRLDGPDGPRTMSIQTSDDRAFSNGGGFDRVAGPRPLPGEATRFTVDGAVRLSTLGGAGASLSGFRVEALAGAQVGDFMPGGCNNSLGPCVQAPNQDSGAYERAGYVLRGPTYYVDVDAPRSEQAVPAGQERMVEVAVSNALADQAQVVTVAAQAADGVQARFHNPSSPDGTGYSATGRAELAPRARSVMHLALSGVTPGASGLVELVVTTDQGGRSVHTVPYTVTGSDGTRDPTSGTGHACTHGEGPGCTGTAASPAIPVAVVAALLLIAARRRA